jgi:hypothetical protein
MLRPQAEPSEIKQKAVSEAAQVTMVFYGHSTCNSDAVEVNAFYCLEDD